MVETDRKMNDGGPAFPHMKAEGHNDYAAGLSLRDWFAGQALVAMSIAAPYSDTARSADYQQAVSAAAYAYADAMLAARKGGSHA